MEHRETQTTYENVFHRKRNACYLTDPHNSQELVSCKRCARYCENESVNICIVAEVSGVLLSVIKGGIQMRKILCDDISIKVLLNQIDFLKAENERLTRELRQIHMETNAFHNVTVPLLKRRLEFERRPSCIHRSLAKRG